MKTVWDMLEERTRIGVPLPKNPEEWDTLTILIQHAIQVGRLLDHLADESAVLVSRIEARAKEFQCPPSATP